MVLALVIGLAIISYKNSNKIKTKLFGDDQYYREHKMNTGLVILGLIAYETIVCTCTLIDVGRRIKVTLFNKGYSKHNHDPKDPDHNKPLDYIIDLTGNHMI